MHLFIPAAVAWRGIEALPSATLASVVQQPTLVMPLLLPQQQQRQPPPACLRIHPQRPDLLHPWAHRPLLQAHWAPAESRVCQGYQRLVTISAERLRRAQEGCLSSKPPVNLWHEPQSREGLQPAGQRPCRLPGPQGCCGQPGQLWAAPLASGAWAARCHPSRRGCAAALPRCPPLWGMMSPAVRCLWPPGCQLQACC